MNERNQNIADEGSTFKHKVIAYVVFAVLFWTPFWLFVRVLQFNQQTALIAASIGAVVLLLIFAPAFQRFVRGSAALRRHWHDACEKHPSRPSGCSSSRVPLGVYIERYGIARQTEATRASSQG